ncbi:tyrosine-type recombinase/integrase [Rhizobium sp.]
MQQLPLKSVRKTFAALVKNSGLSKEITPYSLRHTMATALRKRGVSPWEVEGMLGHRRPGMTKKYAHFQPDYCSQSQQTIDAYFKRLKLSEDD